MACPFPSRGPPLHLAPWQFIGFNEQFDEWQDRENPPEDLVDQVEAWISELASTTDPRHGAHPVSGGDEFEHAVQVTDFGVDGRAVVCTYRIEDDAYKVWCVRFESSDTPPQAGH
jgi:hypothetical protein